jgi:preprotein translocase subunit SecA
MTEPRVLLDAAAFMDAPHARGLEASAADVRTVVQRFLSACYEDLGLAPKALDAEEMQTLLREVLPRWFGVRDPLARVAEPVIERYLEFLAEEAVVPAAFEQRRALAEHAESFRRIVASGTAHEGGVVTRGKGTTIEHRADKTGRNDPCPCGSGKKFKKCCMRIGDA